MSQQSGFISTHLKRMKQIFGIIFTVIGGYYVLLKTGSLNAKEPKRDILPKHIQAFCRKMVGVFDIEVVQVEPVPQNHGLWVSNHVSWMDIPVVGSVCPVFFLSKAEIANWPIIGKLARAGGTLFIQRGSGDADSMSHQIAEFLKNETSVVFFPEATTTSGHKMKRIHGKLLKASMDTGVPINPMVTCYADENGNISDNIAYYGKMSMKESFQKILDSKKITAYVLPLEPLVAQEGQTQRELTAILYERMQVGLATLQKQVLTNKPEGAEWD